MGRSQEAASAILLASVPEAQRESVKALAVDLAAGNVNAAAEVLPKALVVHDRFCSLLSRLAPLRKVVKTQRAHKEGIPAYFTFRITKAVCEGFNAVIETIKKNARGFRRFDHFRDRILFHLGRLDLSTAPA